MSTVRFAHICDHCGERGPEYEAMHQCRECGADTCQKCGSDFRADYSYEGPEDGFVGGADCLCHECARGDVQNDAPEMHSGSGVGVRGVGQTMRETTGPQAGSRRREESPTRAQFCPRCSLSVFDCDCAVIVPTLGGEVECYGDQVIRPTDRRP